jgi:coiled-coil domain-containing protein 130
VPFNIWCSKCGEHIGKGVRFNAEKKAVGAYHSTKIWSFRMRHHCGSAIVIETDPKNAEYVVKEGARRKVEDYDPADAGTVLLPDPAEAAAAAADPLSRLERTTVAARAAAGGRAQLAALAADREAKRDGYSLNKSLRAALRASKKADAALDARWVGGAARGGVGRGAAVVGPACLCPDLLPAPHPTPHHPPPCPALCRRDELGLAPSVKLLPASDADAREAAAALFASDDRPRFDAAWSAKRRRILSESIIPGGGGGQAGGGGGAGGTNAAASGSGGGRGGRPPPAAAAAAGPGRPQLSAAAQALAARVLKNPGLKPRGL